MTLLRNSIFRCYSSSPKPRSPLKERDVLIFQQNLIKYEGKQGSIRDSVKDKPTLRRVITVPKTSQELTELIFKHLMPKDYKTTTLSTYESYAKATMISSTFGTAASVISTQALLASIGVSSGAALPIAATLNWILKDGVGQLGGVLFASSVNTRFDSDPKRFRLGADFALGISVILESCTVIAPWLFLPVASIANIGKNIAWLSASATRASIHQSFCLEHNLADVTGKAGSQTIAASVIGTSLGIALTPLLMNDPVYIIFSTIVLSFAHLAFSFRALHCVQLKTLNIQRAWLSLVPALATLRRINIFDIHSSLCSLDWEKLRSPADVAKKERLIHFGKWGGRDGKANLVSPKALIAASNDDGFINFFRNSFTSPVRMNSTLSINPSIEKIGSIEELKASLSMCFEFDDQHIINVIPSKNDLGSYSVQVWYLKEATPADVLAGFLHAAIVARALSRLGNTVSPDSKFSKLVYDVRNSMQVENACAKFLYGVEDKGWDVKHVFIEESKVNRIHLENIFNQATTSTN